MNAQNTDSEWTHESWQIEYKSICIKQLKTGLSLHMQGIAKGQKWLHTYIWNKLYSLLTTNSNPNFTTLNYKVKYII